MAQTIYGVTSDGGDGSSSIHWFKNLELLDRLLDPSDDKWCEAYNMNEGYAEVLTFPDDLDLEACGFSFNDNDFDDE